MPTPSFDLIDVIKTIQKQKRLILLMTLAAMGVGCIFFLVKKKKYKASAHFLVNNPLYGDRNTVFRDYEQRYVDYFGGDDDLDRVSALLGSDTVKDRIIRNCQFQIVYKTDINTEKGHAFLMGVFDKNFNVKRTEYKEMEVSYIAYDSVTAANVANMAVKVAEETFRSYYTQMRNGMAKSISDKVKQLDTTIAMYTDSLASMRDRNNIYGLISPSRKNTMTSDVKGGGKGFGRAIEEVQNIESIKDQLVIDRARYISLINEHTATTNSAMDYLKVTTTAVPPSGPMGPPLLTILGSAMAIGLFFSVLFVLIMAYYRVLMSTPR